MGFLVAQTVKYLPGMRETSVQSLSREDPLEEGIATHSSFLPGESPGTEEPGGLQSRGSQRGRLSKHTLSHILSAKENLQQQLFLKCSRNFTTLAQ